MDMMKQKIAVPLPVVVVVALMVVALLALVITGSGDGEDDEIAGTVAQQSLDEGALISSLNTRRSTPLQSNAQLETAAQNYANDMAGGGAGGVQGYIDATGFQYVGYGYGTAFWSPAASPQQLADIWGGIGSVVNEANTQVGIGAAATGGTSSYVIIVASPLELTAPGTTNTEPTSGGESPADQQQAILGLVNTARQNAGACPLSINNLLVQASQRHSNDMANNNFLDHTGSDGSSARSRATDAGYPSTAPLGENVLQRSNISASGAFDQWWNSVGHRDNMMTTRFTEVGITYARSPATGQLYYTMVLGSTAGGC